MSPAARAWRIARYGAPAEAFRLDQVEVPAAGDGDLLVRVRAASVNPLDLKLAAGELRAVQKIELPAAAGFDLAGVVEEVGPGATGFARGDEVYARADRLRRGAFAEVVAIQSSAVARKPRSIDFGEAASIPLVGLTTVQALVDRAGARAGQRILIHAGSGGVGTFAVQYAHHLGLHVTSTTSSRNAAFVRELGADEVIAYDRESYLGRKERYAIVFDTLGGETTVESFQVVERGGSVVSIAGPPDAQMADVVGASPPVRAAMWFMRRRVERAARRADARYFRFLTESRGDQLAAIAGLLEAGAIRPVVDLTVPFERAQEGFAHVAGGRSRGKVVLTL